MLSCKEVTEVCSVEMERRLRLGEKVSMGMHLMMCTGCTQYRRQLKVLRKAMQTYAEGRAPLSTEPAPKETAADGSQESR